MSLEFRELASIAHILVNDHINQLVTIKVDDNPVTRTAIKARVGLFEFIAKLRLDFQPAFLTEAEVIELWDDIREQSHLQEMVSTCTLKMLVCYDAQFHEKVANHFVKAMDVLTTVQGAVDEDYFARLFDKETASVVINDNPWFAFLLLVALGQEEYVKPAIQVTD